VLTAGRTITCPHCWERIEVAVDLSICEQEYVEDCFVCCRPILIYCRTDAGEFVELRATAENGA